MAQQRRKKWKPEPEKTLEINGVPTLAGLEKMGRRYAYPDANGKIHVTDEGHQLMQEALARNAREAITKGTWHGISGKHAGPPAQPGLGG